MMKIGNITPYQNFCGVAIFSKKDGNANKEFLIKRANDSDILDLIEKHEIRHAQYTNIQETGREKFALDVLDKVKISPEILGKIKSLTQWLGYIQIDGEAGMLQVFPDHSATARECSKVFFEA